eukprot:m.473916 g.473916  ORF g.473916 m.473916 type:complete len:250 (-) comp21670_c1_seq2:217-966(-)
MSDLRRRGHDSELNSRNQKGLNLVDVSIKHRGVVFKGEISPILTFREVCEVIGLSSDSQITVIHKGTKLQSQHVLPIRGCTLLVLDRIDAAEEQEDDLDQRGSEANIVGGAVLSWVGSFVPSIVSTSASSIVGWASQALPNFRRASSSNSAAEVTDNVCVSGRIVTLRVDYRADSPTASHIDIRWTAHGCGELLMPLCERVENAVDGVDLYTDQRLQCNGDPGTVTCVIKDDVGEAKKTFNFVPEQEFH